jgi:hypothetical protein
MGDGKVLISTLRTMRMKDFYWNRKVPLKKVIKGVFEAVFNPMGYVLMRG